MFPHLHHLPTNVPSLHMADDFSSCYEAHNSCTLKGQGLLLQQAAPRSCSSQLQNFRLVYSTNWFSF